MVSTSPEPALERAPHPPTEHLQGIVERVTFHAEFRGVGLSRNKFSFGMALIRGVRASVNDTRTPSGQMNVSVCCLRHR